MLGITCLEKLDKYSNVWKDKIKTLTFGGTR